MVQESVSICNFNTQGCSESKIFIRCYRPILIMFGVCVYALHLLYSNLHFFLYVTASIPFVLVFDHLRIVLLLLTLVKIQIGLKRLSFLFILVHMQFL